MDPYDVLGIPPSSSNAEVNKAYIALVKKTHPDKVKNQSDLFRIIKKAYDTIHKERKFIVNAPFEKNEYKEYLHKKGAVKFDKHTFTIDKFNDFYEKHSLDIRTSGYIDNIDKDRESVKDLYDKPLNTTFRRGVVKYRIPHAIETSYFSNCDRIGITSNDKSTTHGFDYMRAHMNVEKIKKVKQKYNSIEECVSVRDREQSFVLTAEDEKREKKIQTKKENKERFRKLEIRRLDSIREVHNDKLYNILCH